MAVHIFQEAGVLLKPLFSIRRMNLCNAAEKQNKLLAPRPSGQQG